MDRIERAKKYAAEFAEIGRANLSKHMNPAQEGLGFVICYIHMRQNATVYAGDIAKASGVSTARVAAALKKLESQGLITRQSSSSDNRRTIVRLTEAGMRRAEEMRTRMLNTVAEIIDLIGEEDMNDYLRITRRICEAMPKICEKGEADV